MWNPFSDTTRADYFAKQDKYLVDIHCNNCGFESEYAIPNGKTVQQFLQETPCPNCKCSNTLQRA